MKLYNKFLTASALLSIAVAVSSCSNKEDDIFDQSAANRMDAAKTETKALLVSAENGWELSYFADNDWEEGHVILMKFHNDESVDMAASNVWVANEFMSTDKNAVQRETSLYQMISDDGPVLTFNTFNKLLHIFSEPYNLPSAGYNPENVPFPNGPTEKNPVSGSEGDADESGYGHNGDYEFVVLSKTNDEILLRGKKTRVNMRMRRLAPDQDWDAYFATINRLAESTFSNRFGDLKIVVGGHDLHLSNLTSGVMNILADDDDPLMETVKIPFLYTPDGIRLREPYTGYEDRLADIAFQNFTFNPDGTLSCVEQSAEFALNSSFSEIFLMSAFKWELDLSSATGQIASYINDIQAECAEKNAYKSLKGLTFDYSNRRYRMKISLSGSSSNAFIYGTPSAEEDSLNFIYDPENGDSNGKSRVKNLPSLKALLDYWSSHKWVVTTDTPLAPTSLKLTNADNPADTFTLSL